MTEPFSPFPPTHLFIDPSSCAFHPQVRVKLGPAEISGLPCVVAASYAWFKPSRHLRIFPAQWLWSLMPDFTCCTPADAIHLGNSSGFLITTRKMLVHPGIPTQFRLEGSIAHCLWNHVQIKISPE